MARVAVIAGDGIGKEVIPAGMAVVKKAAAACGASVEFVEFPWGCDFYRAHGRMMAEDGFDRLQEFDAIYLGAIGDPSVPDHIAVWQLILPIRQRFDQYVNLRPMRLVAGVTTPLAGRTPADIDMVIVRENNEGEYSEIGGRLYRDTPEELAVQQSVFTRRGCDRIMRYAFELARRRPRHHVTSATKSNGIIHSMPYWDERFAAMGKDYPQVKTAQYHIDILVDVRARARLGPRHRGQGHREPHRADLDGRHAARASRPRGGGPGRRGRHRARGGGWQGADARSGRHRHHHRRRRGRGGPRGRALRRPREDAGA